VISLETLAIRPFEWAPAFRIVPTRFPSTYLFDRVADPEDFDALYALEALTNERMRDELGEIELVPRNDRIFGPGSGPIMAAFTHLNPQGSRFSDGSYGVFYAAVDRATAIEETKFHHGAFLAATAQGPMTIQMRLYTVSVSARLHDLRELDAPDVYSLTSYAHSQALGRRLRENGSLGVGYRSVRHEGGSCVGLFHPKCASACLHAAYLAYAWDGRSFTSVYERIG
jgi:hypothetical protein